MEMNLKENIYMYNWITLLYTWNIVNQLYLNKKKKFRGFPGGAVVKNPPANAGDTGSSPGLGRSHMPRSN